MEKLIVMIMGQNCEKFIKMCLDSTEDADARIYCDGGSTDSTLDIVENRIGKKSIISNKYDQEDKKMNGKQRNFYLKYLKKHYPDDWCLCLDADEVVDNLNSIKVWLEKYGSSLAKRHPCIHVKMRHFIGDLGHEDTTAPEHMCLSRLFKITKDLEYPEVEHPVLSLKGLPIIPENICRATTIWHMAYVPNLWEIKKRYDNHMKKSNMHSPEFLNQWYRAHLFGQYPKGPITLTDIPETILSKFGIDKDELYFANRGLEVKHFLMAKQWVNFVKNHYADNLSFIEFGCGKAPYGFALNSYNIEYEGVELSQFAVDNSFVPIQQGDILTYKSGMRNELAIAFDVLEHLKYEDLDKAINNLIANTYEHILISVPVLGDPNLLTDPTHIIKETKEWWIKQFLNKNCKLVETPANFLFREQILIFEVDKK